MRFFTKRVVLLTVLLLTVIGVRANISLNNTAYNNTTTTYVRTTGSSDIVKWIDAGDVTVEIDYRNEDATVIAAAEKYKGDVTIPEEALEWMYDPAVGSAAVSNSYPISGIASHAFQNCTELNSLMIPKSITMVGMDGTYFNGCTALKTINVDPENRFYSSINGVLYNKDQTTLICVPEEGSQKIIKPDGTVEVHSMDKNIDKSNNTEKFIELLKKRMNRSTD